MGVIRLTADGEDHMPLEQEECLFLAVVSMGRRPGLGQDERLKQSEHPAGLRSGKQGRVGVADEEDGLAAVRWDVHGALGGCAHEASLVRMWVS